MIHSGLLLEGRVKFKFTYTKLQTKLSSSIFSLASIIILVRNDCLPLPVVSLPDPYSVRAYASLIDDFYKIAVQDVVESSGSVNP